MAKERRGDRNLQGAGKQGWIVAVLEKMVKSSVVCVPTGIGKTQVAPIDGPLSLVHQSVSEAVNACAIAVAGFATKGAKAAIAPAAPGNLTLQLAVKAFGYIIRFSSPPTEWPGGMIPFKVVFDTGLGTERTFNFTIRGDRHIYEAIILSYADNAGKGEITTATTVDVTVTNAVGAYVAASTWLSIESLNARDLGIARR
jgi:hypothetical protein